MQIAACILYDLLQTAISDIKIILIANGTTVTNIRIVKS